MELNEIKRKSLEVRMVGIFMFIMIMTFMTNAYAISLSGNAESFLYNSEYTNLDSESDESKLQNEINNNTIIQPSLVAIDLQEDIINDNVFYIENEINEPALSFTGPIYIEEQPIVEITEVVEEILEEETYPIENEINEPALSFTGPIYIEEQPIVEITEVVVVEEILEEETYPIEYESLFTTLPDKYPNMDFGIDELNHLIEQCETASVPTYIMLSIYEIESHLQSTAINKTSYASGYGQITRSTATYMYETILELGTYGGKDNYKKHAELACEKEFNITITTELMSHLYSKYKSWDLSVQYYFGHTDAAKRKNYSKIIETTLYNNYGFKYKDL